MEVERRELQGDIKSQQEEITKLKLEKSMAERKIDKEKRITHKVEEKLEDERTNKLVLEAQIKSMQKDIDAEKHVEGTWNG